MRILGVDYGEVRTGLALSDPLEMLASAVETVTAYQPEKAARAVADKAIALKAEHIVLGLPKNMDGSEGFRAEATRGFGELLKEMTGLPLTYWDERQTTNEAHRILADNGRSGKRRKAVVDQVAAVVILQSYLDSRPRSF